MNLITKSKLYTALNITGWAIIGLIAITVLSLPAISSDVITGDMVIIGVSLIVIASAIAFGILSSTSYLKDRLLYTDGETIVATISSIIGTSDSSDNIYCKYSVQGEVYVLTFTVDEGKYKEGDQIKLRYLPHRPRYAVIEKNMNNEGYYIRIGAVVIAFMIVLWLIVYFALR